MIGRALQAWILGWLVSFAVVISPYVIEGIVRNGSLRGVGVPMFAFWTFAVLLVVFCVLILPLYLWLPDSVRELRPMVRAMIGAGVACFVCVAWPLFLELPSVLPAALAAGGLIGYMVPRNAGAEG
jgi:hypothetical protein